MAKELNEETGFNISVKTLMGIGFAMATLIGMWFTLQADIAEAKELPKPEISKMEFNMKDVNIRQSIKNTEKNVEKLEERMIRMEDKIDALR
jgi:ribosomal protein S13